VDHQSLRDYSGPYRSSDVFAGRGKRATTHRLLSFKPNIHRKILTGCESLKRVQRSLLLLFWPEEESQTILEGIDRVLK
jgi:hypothetical protein